MSAQETAYKRFSTTPVLWCLVLVSLLGFVSSASAGPFLVSLPIEGLQDEDLPAIKKIFDQRFGDKVQPIAVKDGALKIFGSLENAKTILRLEEMIAAVETTGLAVDMNTWLLEPQVVGVYVAADSVLSAPQLEKAIESFDEVTVKVMGILLDESRMCIVVQFSKEIDYAAFDRALQEAGVLIQGLCVGHWRAWGIQLAGEARGHDFGARLKPKKD